MQGFHLSADMRGLLHPLARSHRHNRYHSNIGGSSLPRWLDRALRSSIIPHYDGGSQFESALWQQLMCLLGPNRIRTMAYHPSANGLVERFHHQLKASLMFVTPSTQWVEALPMVLLGIWTCVKEDLGCCTEELVYGTTANPRRVF